MTIKKRTSKRHDEYFKANKKLWDKSVLEGLLPNELIEQIDFDTLKLESTEYIDADLSAEAADLVLAADLKNKKDSIGIIILIEHKSYEDYLALVQILRYATLEWVNDLNASKGQKPLRFIIPILVYHLPLGKIWPYAIKLQDLFEKQSLACFERFIPKFEIITLNLAQDKIPAHLTPLLLLVEASMFSTELELYNWYKRIQKTDSSLLNSEYLNQSSIYIQLSNKNNLNFRKVIKLISEDKTMQTYSNDLDQSYYFAAEQKGLEKGIEKGIEQGIEKEQVFKLAMAKELLQRGMLPDEVAQISNLAIEKIQSLNY